MIVSWGINTEVVGRNKVKCLWLKLVCLYIHVYMCIYRIIYTLQIWYDVYCKYFYTQVYIAYACTCIYIFTSQFIYAKSRYAYTIHTTPILLIPGWQQTRRTFSADVCCRCPGLFCTASSKGPEGMGFDGMDWGKFQGADKHKSHERKWTKGEI